MTVLVIGGGMTGSVAALELVRSGADVVVVEANTAPMSGASRYNEGKIHLGYVYAKDANGRTIAQMQEGAKTFAAILTRHLPSGLAQVPVSRPFDYVVHPESQLTAADVGTHNLRVEAALTHRGMHAGPRDYLGHARVQRPHWRSGPETTTLALSGSAGRHIYATEERALEPFSLADAVSTALLSSKAELRCGVTVDGVLRHKGAYWASTSAGTMGPFESVVNASWGSCQLIDHSMGLSSNRTWNYRFKYFLRVHKAGIGQRLPNLTWVLGPFGDVVTYGNDLAYLSWYPAGRVEWRTGDAPQAPPAQPDSARARELKQGILSGLSALLPALSELDATRDDISVFGGLIVGNGCSDIDDPNSGLHQRDNIGIRSLGGFHSVSSGKLTTTVLMGERAAAAVLSGVQR